MGPEVLFELIPVSFPMTHTATVCDLAARCPVDAWERAGGKASSVQSLCELALKISKNHEGNPRQVMKIALKELTNEDNPDPEEMKRLKERH
eukprot:3586518-Pyramimonas_sp.AAC.1